MKCVLMSACILPQAYYVTLNHRTESVHEFNAGNGTEIFLNSAR